MLASEIIRRKRDGVELSADELDYMAAGIGAGSIGEGQAAAFAMAVFFRGMSPDETASWTRAMTASGSALDWSRDAPDGPLLDKHSTGGIGDKVSLVLAPMLAACGAYVPMISGRGLGHTGGTLDKLESIPGLRTQFDEQAIKTLVRTVGCAIVGATDSVAPADRVLYAVRDVTATIESVPLITASILSKKLAAGLDALVLDVKTGSGAFAASMPQARELADSLVAVGNRAGLSTLALITDMDQVLGRNAGNAVEVREAVSYLAGENADERFDEVVMSLGVEALMLGRLADRRAVAETMLRRSLEDGSAAERFGKMLRAQGAPADLVDKPGDCLPAAPVVRPVFHDRDGYVARVDVRRIGLAIVEMGGGRTRPGGAVDHSVGFTGIAGPGDRASPHHPVATVHAASDADARKAADDILRAVEVSDDPSGPRPAVLERRQIPPS